MCERGVLGQGESFLMFGPSKTHLNSAVIFMVGAFSFLCSLGCYKPKTTSWLKQNHRFHEIASSIVMLCFF